jgi:hypothetical protein
MGRNWLSGAWLVLCVAALAACGGGGGGGPAPASAPASTDGTVAIQGVATFDSVPNASSGRLDYGATGAKPIRGALVEAVSDNGDQVLASGTTSDTGAYALSVPVNTAVQIRVRAQLQRSGAPSWDVTVRDNTASGAIYSIQSGSFGSGSAASLQRDIHAPSGWNGSAYASVRAAGPFALLDTVYTAVNKVVSVAPTLNFPALRVYWSVNNVPSSGDLAVGQIGTTFFRSEGSGNRTIYVLGRADVDTDEYDASVVTHEWGHYYQSAFSRDDSPGGPHGPGDLLDRRLAFSEGWGNAWSGIALGRSTYSDSGDAGQASGFSLDLSTGPAANRGWFNEQSLQAVFWNLERAAGFGAIHAAMTGPFKNGLPVTSIHPFAAAFAVAAPSQAGTLSNLLTGQAISPSTNDPFGTLETNSGGVALATPLYGTTATQACVTNQAGSANKLGNFAYLRFTLPSAGAHRIVVAGPGSTDPDFAVYQGGLVAASDALAPATEDATLNLPAGESVLVIQDFNGTTACFNVSIT